MILFRERFDDILAALTKPVVKPLLFEIIILWYGEPYRNIRRILVLDFEYV